MPRPPAASVRRWCEDLDRRLRAGDDGRAEDYLARDPDLDPEDAVELVYTEFACREELGQPADPAAFLARFPALRGPLEEQFLVHAALHGDPDRRAAAPASGQHVGPYRLERELGRGGRGAVFAAADTRKGHESNPTASGKGSTEERVALKLLLSGEYATPDDLALFRHEAAVLGRLAHPNLIRILDAGVADGRPFLALEFVDGPTLAARIGDYRDPRAAAGLVETLARAVHHAHTQGVVHRDLKPSNVLLAGGTPKVSDFGLARVLDGGGGRTRTGDILGTLGYMAPEQAAGAAHRAGPPADVYALGAILFELLTGRTPFGPDPSAATLYRLLNDPPPAVTRFAPGTPRDLDTVCAKCLEKSPGSRYPSALALADDLRRFLDGRPVTARPVGAATHVARWAGRRPSAAALVVVLAVTLVGVTAGLAYHAGVLRDSLGRAEALNGELQTALRTAERLRGETRRQNDRLEKQLDDAKRAMYALQMSQLPVLWRKEPVRARGLLADVRTCPPELRDFTWRYFDHACGLDERELDAHKGPVSAVAFLPDGRLVTAGDDGKFRVWADGKAVSGGNHGAGVTGLVVLDGGAAVATVGRDRRLKRWRTGDFAKPTRTAKLPSAPQKLAVSLGNPFPQAGGIAGSADGSTLAVPCADGFVRLFAADTLAPVGSLPAHCGPATVAAFAADGTRIATAGEDGQVTVWDAGTREPLRTWAAHPDAVRALAFAPDGRAVVSGSDGGEVRVWDPATGTGRRALSGHLFAVHAVGFAPDGTRMLTGGFDSYLKLWDPATGTELTNVMRRWVTAAAFAPDGESVAIGSPQGKVSVFRAPAVAPAIAYPHPANVVSVAARPGGAGYVTGDAAGVVRVWDAGNAAPAAVRKFGDGPVRALAVSPDGAEFAVGAGSDVVFTDATLRELRRGKGHTGTVTAAAFDPTSRFLATGSADKSVRIWDAVTGEPVATLTGHTDAIEAVTFDPAGTRVASASDDGTLRIWAADGWQSVAVLKGHGNWVLSAAFDPTGRFLASGGRDRTVRVWDTKGPNPPLVLTGYTNWVYAVEYAADGKTLVAASGHYSIDTPGEVKFLDPAAGYVRAILTDVRAPVRFGSPDRLAAAAPGGLAELIASPAK